MKYLFVLLVVFLFYGIYSCEKPTLADDITLGLLEIRAVRNGQVCYENNNNNRFCLVYIKKE